MKFIVSSTALSIHLQAVSRVINSKNALPILDCFLFDLQEGTLSVTASDSETTMVTSLEVNESDADGRFAVTAKTLLDALKEIPEQPLAFDVNINTLEINVQYQNGKYSLMGQNADEFPQLTQLGDNAVRVEIDAEVLLNYAEATYELSGSISDADLDMSLNLVRLRVNPDMPKLSNSLINNNGLSMREEIRRERTVELYNEGFRIDDLKRWKTAEVEMPKDILGIQWTGEFQTEWPNAASYQKDKDGCLIIETGRTWSSKNYLYPLPSDQLQLNPNLGQNPGWEE